MPTYEITTPDGRKFEVSAPEGASQHEVLAYAKANAPKASAKPKPNFFGDVRDRVTGAWDKLASDTADDYQRHTAGRPGENLFTRQVEDDRRTARMAGNVFNLAISPVTGVIDAAITKPAARALNELPIRPQTRDNPFSAPRPMHGEESQAFYEGAIGTALSAVRPGPVKAAAPRPRPQPPLKPSQLKPAKDAAYAAAEASGARYKGSTFNGFITALETDLKAERISRMRHPKAFDMLQEIKTLKGREPTLSELDDLRQVVRRDVANSPDQADARLGKMMIRAIDDFLTVAGPKQVVAGDPRAAAANIRTARDLNTRLRKVGAVEEALGKAQRRAARTGSGGNVDNTTRQNVDRLIDEIGNWTPDERSALEAIVKGGHGQNFLRQIGKLSPQGNGLMTALNIGGAAVNPWLAVPGVSGLLAKMGADAMTAKKVKELLDLVAAGGSRAAARRPRPRLPSARTAVGAAEVASPLARSQEARREGRKADLVER